MTIDPPLLTGAVHVKAIYVAFVFVLTIVKAVGGLGTVAARTENTELSVPVPMMFIDAI